MTDLKELVRMGGEWAHNVLIKDGEPSLMPLYHIEPKSGPSLVIGCPWRNEEEKLASFQEVKRFAAEHEAVAVTFISEVWMVKIDTPTSWHMKRAINVIPSQSPDRIEAVQVIATDGDNTVAGSWQIVRDKPGGSIIALVEEKQYNGKFSGRMIDGLIPKRKS